MVQTPDGGKGRATDGDHAALAADVSLSPAALAERLRLLNKKVLDHAKNLEFEEAVSLRDELTEVNQAVLVR